MSCLLYTRTYASLYTNICKFVLASGHGVLASIAHCDSYIMHGGLPGRVRLSCDG